MIKPYNCPGGCHAVLDERDTRSCWRCGTPVIPIEPDPSTMDSPDVFTHQGYDISWEDFRAGFVTGEIRGEWVAKSHNGVAAIRMPAIVSNIAGDATRTSEKLKTLRKLINLIDGSN